MTEFTPASTRNETSLPGGPSFTGGPWLVERKFHSLKRRQFMANVYWIKGRAENLRRNLVSKIDALLNLKELAGLIKPDESLAIKMNLSELGYSHYLPPVIIGTLFEKTRAMGAKSLITDNCSLFKGSKFDGYSWMDNALMMGFSNGDVFDNQMMLSAGYTNEEGNFRVGDGEYLAGVEIGSLLTDTGNLIVVSHVTAHPVLGLAGAISNLGLGFLTRSGRLKIHGRLEISVDDQACDHCGICMPFCPTGAISGKSGRISFDLRMCNRCLGCYVSCPNGAIGILPEGIPEYQKCVVDAAHTVKKHLRGEAFFINFLTSVTPQSDDYPFSDIPFVPDLGIIASDDPVAVDWATYQMIVRSPGVPGSIAQDLDVLEKGQDKIKAITGQTPVEMLNYAEKIQLGNKNFKFLSSP
jgi:hypothetical protein